MAMTDENKKNLTAWHEAGQCAGEPCCLNTRIHCTRVTIYSAADRHSVRPLSLPKEDILNYRKKELLDSITMTMAGRNCRGNHLWRHFDRSRGGDIQAGHEHGRNANGLPIRP